MITLAAANAQEEFWAQKTLHGRRAPAPTTTRASRSRRAIETAAISAIAEEAGEGRLITCLQRSRPPQAKVHFRELIDADFSPDAQAIIRLLGACIKDAPHT